MGLYAFELGRIKNLSLAELNSVLGEENFVEKVWEFAIFNLGSESKKGKAGAKSTPPSFDSESLQNRLGGTIKIAEIVETLDKNAKESEIRTSIENLLTDNLKDSSGKIPFAISAINIQGNSKFFLKDFLNYSKKILKSFGLNCRFVNKPWMNPSPAQVYKSKAISKGVDITVIRGQSLYIAKSVAIQNIDAYSARDFEKPFRDARMGMLPPKLAQMMINFADGASDNNSAKFVFDPFCGSGTILLEAILQGKQAIGSDIDTRAVEGTKKNIEWLKENFKNTLKIAHGDKADSITAEVFQRDIAKITAKDLPKEVDAIVTEGYLGLPASRIIPSEERAKRFDEIATLHSSWLGNLKNILPKESFKNLTIVLTLPAFAIGNNKHDFFPNPKEFFGFLGYKILNKEVLVYDREDQFIAREIVILKTQ